MKVINIFKIFNPKTWQAFIDYNTGLRLLMQGKISEACESFLVAATKQSSNPVYHAMLGISYTDLQNYDAAQKELIVSIECGIGRNRLASEVYGFLGIIYLQKKDLDNALISFSKSLDLWKDPTSRIKKNTLYQNLGGLYRRKKQFEKAVEMYKKAREEDPNNPEYNILLGLAYWDYGQKDLAKEEVNKGIDIDPALSNKFDVSEIIE